MRTIVILLRKEFLQIFRNRAMLPIIFAMPVIQLLILSFAATFDVKNTDFALVDDDGSRASARLVEQLQAGGYFTLAGRFTSAHQADRAMARGDVGLILRIPRGFEESLGSVDAASLQLTVDAQDGATAGVVQAYASQIIAGFGSQERGRSSPQPSSMNASVEPARIQVLPALWYNPQLNYTTYMVPGILVLLVTMIGTFLSAMNVVREKEIGTIEQLNVTPVRRFHFVVGKLLPFWVIALVELAIGLVVARVVFDVPMLGSIPLVFLMAGVYLLVMLGIGLFISTTADTQQQAMFLAWFIMVIFILMSGLFTPIESMPRWAQHLTIVNPVAHFIEIMRRVLLKGAGFSAVSTQFWLLSGYAVAVLSLAISRYSKTAR